MGEINGDITAIYKRNYSKTSIVLTLICFLLVSFTCLELYFVFSKISILNAFNFNTIEIKEEGIDYWEKIFYIIMTIYGVYFGMNLLHRTMYIILSIISILFLIKCLIFCILGLKKSMSKRTMIPCIIICGCLLIALFLCGRMGLTLFIK